MRTPTIAPQLSLRTSNFAPVIEDTKRCSCRDDADHCSSTAPTIAPQSSPDTPEFDVFTTMPPTIAPQLLRMPNYAPQYQARPYIRGSHKDANHCSYIVKDANHYSSTSILGCS
jgi:hypothetical protein